MVSTYTPGQVTSGQRRLLVWDAPNIDVALGTLLGGRAPSPKERPRFDALGRWLVERAADDDVAPEACVFANLHPARLDQMRGWIDVIRSAGFSVFAKPKLADKDDIDEDLVALVHRHVEAGDVCELLIASGDRFRDLPSGDLLDLGDRVPLTIVGFREYCTGAIRTEGVRFVDLEDIPGVFETRLHREMPLDRIPAEGAWLPARRTLRDLYAGDSTPEGGHAQP